ncbi:hypothetical protein [Bacillus mycoides]|uniref:hypothetical protein n=1 Tax=Bacillus mycoides TaxID=1405 RepID=UPI003D1D18BD
MTRIQTLDDNIPLGLYEISMPGYEKLKWYPIEVKRGKQTFHFEVYRSGNEIFVFYIDELGRKRAVTSTEELTMMLVVEEDKKRFREFVGDSRMGTVRRYVYRKRDDERRDICVFIFEGACVG